jgi:hypothetical protein
MRLPATISLAADQANRDRETPPVAAARLDDPPRMHGRKGARILAESLSEPGMPLAHALRQEHFDRAADKLALGPAEHRLGGGVQAGNIGVFSKGDNAVRANLRDEIVGEHFMAGCIDPGRA